MDLSSKKAIENLLKKHKVYPSKKLGQNFLINKLVLEKIIKAGDLTPKDTVLEIGSGIGNLTLELAKKAKKVIAIEKDKKMIEILREVLKDFKNAEIIHADILKFNPKISKTYKLVANLPYYLASSVIRKFLEPAEADPLQTKNRPRQMVLMVQKEVAQRICALPPKMNILAISVQFYAKPEIISYVSKKSFWPRPKVDSAIIKINPRNRTPLSNLLRKRFFKIVKAGFSHPRKQLVNNLLALNSLYKYNKLTKEDIKNWLLKNKINPSQRAETLTLQDWLRLTKNLKNLLP